MTKNIVFMGSPDFAAAILKPLAQQFNVVGVVTQPDKPSGRGRVLTPPAVKVVAEELHLPVMQPLRLKNPESFAQLESWHPDAIVVAAFGQILRQNVLDLPRLGCINVHASYLPRWRGAAPIQAAILSGDEFTGVSIMKMDAGIDTGPVYRQVKEYIRPEDTADSLGQRLAELGAKTLLAALPEIFAGTLTAQEQMGEATYASMLKKEEGLLDWTQPAVSLERRVRAFNDWPGTYFLWKEAPLKVRRAQVVPNTNTVPGKRLILAGLPTVQTSSGSLQLLEVQPAGKKWMGGKDFLNGNPDWARE